MIHLFQSLYAVLGEVNTKDINKFFSLFSGADQQIMRQGGGSKGDILGKNCI